MKLNELAIGHSAIIEEVGGKGSLRQHLLDMGVIPGVTVTLVKLAPMGDPIEIRVHNYELTLRLEDAKRITIREVAKAEKTERKRGMRADDIDHPGLGETGKFHPKGTGTPLPDEMALITSS